MMDIGLTALLLLLLVVVLGFWRKVNVGLLAIAGAAVLGYASGQFSGCVGKSKLQKKEKS